MGGANTPSCERVGQCHRHNRASIQRSSALVENLLGQIANVVATPHAFDGHPLKLPRVPLPLHFAVLPLQSVPILTVSLQGCSSFQRRQKTAYSSWLNQVELWFSKIDRDVIARGVFTFVSDLKRKLLRYIRHYNKSPRTVKWKYAAPPQYAISWYRPLVRTR